MAASSLWSEMAGFMMRPRYVPTQHILLGGCMVLLSLPQVPLACATQSLTGEDTLMRNQTSIPPLRSHTSNCRYGVQREHMLESCLKFVLYFFVPPSIKGNRSRYNQSPPAPANSYPPPPLSPSSSSSSSSRRRTR